jgi:hypothetical protein
MDEQRMAALVELGVYLQARNYEFTTVTPLTHQRVLRNRGDMPACGMRDALGGDLPEDAAPLGHWL